MYFRLADELPVCKLNSTSLPPPFSAPDHGRCPPTHSTTHSTRTSAVYPRRLPLLLSTRTVPPFCLYSCPYHFLNLLYYHWHSLSPGSARIVHRRFHYIVQPHTNPSHSNCHSSQTQTTGPWECETERPLQEYMSVSKNRGKRYTARLRMTRQHRLERRASRESLSRMSGRLPLRTPASSRVSSPVVLASERRLIKICGDL